MGVTVADPLVARSLGDSVAARPLRPRLKLTYGFLYPVARDPAPLVLDFAATVAATAVRLAPDEITLLRAQTSGR